MGFIRWMFSNDAPPWVGHFAFATIMSIGLSAWLLFLILAPAWLLLALVAAVPVGCLAMAYLAYKRKA